jgi:peptidoglycan/LPS O-acetylase OafA/YrhL
MRHTTPRYLSTLTPLRGIAALLVVVFHSDLLLAPFMPPRYTNLIRSGWMWVDFFFMLSGFILSYVYAKEFTQVITWSGYSKYLSARFARIYPLHLLTLLIALIGSVVIVNIADGLDPFFRAMFDPSTSIASLFLLQGMHLYRIAPLNTPAWSLSTEWWMYMIFPLLVPAFASLRWRGKLTTLSLLGASYLVLMYCIGPISGNFGGGRPTIDLVADFGFLRCAAGFLLGMLFCELYVSRTAHACFSNDLTFTALFLGVLIAMHLGVHELLTLSFFPLILIAAAYNETIIRRVLESRPLQKLGDWSFSLYMVHVPILYVFWILKLHSNPTMFADVMALLNQKPDYQSGLIELCIFLPITLMVSALTYRYIEIPSRNYLNALFNTKHLAVLSERGSTHQYSVKE